MLAPEETIPLIELEVRTSERTGSRYVMARNLHAALGLAPGNYSRDVQRWFTEDYGFADDVRRPIEDKEYSSYGKSTPAQGGQAAQDYFIKLNLAKLITLNSKSPAKKHYARYLMQLEQQVEDADLLSPEQIITMMDLAHAMTLISCQKTAERKHHSTYLEKGGKLSGWWDYRAKLLGYTLDQLRDAMYKMGLNAAKRNRRVLLQKTGDKHQLIREGVMDLFLALGRSERYADNMGRIAFEYAQRMKLTIYNDEGASIDFTQGINQAMVQQITALRNKGGFMGLW